MSAFRYNKLCCSYILLVSLLALLDFATVTEAISNWSYCDTTSIRTNPEFYANLDSLLSLLVPTGGNLEDFHKTVKGGGTPDFVAGQYLCFGYVDSFSCGNCVSAAADAIRSSDCMNRTEGAIWLDNCMLLYQNRSDTFDDMYNDETGINEGWLRSSFIISSSKMEQERFNALVDNLLNGLVARTANNQSKEKYATAESNFANWTIHSFVQCMPDLDIPGCNACLMRAIETIQKKCAGHVGCRILTTGCMVRYEVKPFYKVTTSSTEPRVFPATPPVAAPDPTPPGKKGIGSQMIIVIVVPISIGMMLICGGCYFLQSKRRKRHKAILKENFGEETDTLKSLEFNLAIIEAATNKFSSENMIGKGGFGEVYKGMLPNGQQIAVKRLSKKSRQGSIEFKNEILLIAKLQHRNLVTLLGFCLEDQEKILMYEYVPNKSLDYFLFGSQKQSCFNWSTRLKIVEGVAGGILYLHEYSRLKIIHRDLKPSNILLDNNMNPKISDFGMAKMVAIEQDQGSTNRIVGTHGYMSPEYMLRGQFSQKSDVFSFGVVILEIISGKRNASSNASHLLSHAWRKWHEKTPLEILDPYLEESYVQVEFVRCLQIGLLCVQDNPEDRPTMSSIVSYLNNLSLELPIPKKPAFFTHDSAEPIPNSIVIESSLNQFTNESTQYSSNEISQSELFPR